MLTVYFALIGFRPSFWINLGLLQLLWFFTAVNAEELFQGWTSDSRLQWGKQRDHTVVTRGRQPASSAAVSGSSHGHIPDEALWSWIASGSTRQKLLFEQGILSFSVFQIWHLQLLWASCSSTMLWPGGNPACKKAAHAGRLQHRELRCQQVFCTSSSFSSWCGTL